jgi:hypothetical protein
MKNRLVLIVFTSVIVAERAVLDGQASGEHPALQKMNFINFFLCLWVVFGLSGSGSRDPNESGSGSTTQYLTHDSQELVMM